MTTRLFIPAALGLWLSLSAGYTHAQETAPVPAPAGALNLRPAPAAGNTAAGNTAPTNQELADRIAAALRGSGLLRDYRIDIACLGGRVELTGQVGDLGQRQAALRLAQAVPGVEQVVDGLQVAGQAIVTIQGTAPIPIQTAPIQIQKVDPLGPEAGPKLPDLTGKMPPEPLSLVPPAAAMMPNPAYQPPPMPPYAWPTYAPYNNFSRVAYPTLYPYEAWPFIGPFYPFPKVPPGWRAVTLRWQDGHWWYGKDATGHDWWRIRYW